MGKALEEKFLLEEAAVIVDVAAVCVEVLGIDIRIFRIKRDFSYHCDDKQKREYKY